MKDLKLFVSLLIVCAIIALVVFMIPLKHRSPMDTMRDTQQNGQNDETSAINADLNQIDLGTVDGAFTDIDQDLNSL